MPGITVSPGGLPGIMIITPRVHQDDRGYFLETWNLQDFRQAGLPTEFVQDNLSRSRQGVIRGLHFQRQPHAQGKLVRVVRGRILDVVLDLRSNSGTFMNWWAWELSDLNHQALWIPPGFAHGFQVLSDFADFQYRTDRPWVPSSESGIRWDDPELGISWPLSDALVSARDQALPGIEDLEPGWEYRE